MRFKLLACVLFGILLSVACKKSNDAAPAPQAAPASPAPAASAPAAASADSASGTVENAGKIAGAEWAIKQDEIKNDPNGQWAISATASSTYGDAQSMASFSANQVTGPPNVDKYGDDGKA